MATSKIIFNIPKAAKESAMRRAKREGTTLTSILNSTLRAYGEGTLSFDPRFDILTKDDLKKVRKAKEDARVGRTYTIRQMRSLLKR